MFSVKDLKIIDQKNRVFVEGLSFNLDKNDKIGIIGEEGNGKSTLLKIFAEVKDVDAFVKVSGQIISDMNFAYMAQSLEKVWLEQTLVDYLLKAHPDDEIEVEQYNQLQRIQKIAIDLHLPSDFILRDVLVKQLSGGEKVKLQLLKIMLYPFDGLLLDEPTNDLDISTLLWLEDFMKNCSVPLLFVSHDEVLLQNVANRILHLEQLNKKTKCSHTLFRGCYEEYVASRLRYLHKEEQLAHKEKIAYFKKKEKLNQIMNAVGDALNDTVRDPTTARLLAKKMKAVKVMERRFEEEGYRHVDSVEEAIDVFFEPVVVPRGKCILDVRLPFLKIEERVLLEDIHIQLYGNQKKVIVGDNGSGKTLLLRKLAKQLSQRTDIKLGYMPQNYMEGMNMEENGLRFIAFDGKLESMTRARELLGRMKFTREEMEHPIHQLSYGQQAKLYLTKFIFDGCDVLLLDEPTRNLSPLTAPAIRRLLIDFDGAILAVSHDRKFIEEVFSAQLLIEHQHLKEVIQEKN